MYTPSNNPFSQKPVTGSDSAAAIDKLSDNIEKLTDALASQNGVKKAEKTTWKELFIKYTERFVIALATIALLGALVAATYAIVTLGILNPLSLMITSVAGLGLIVALIAYGLFKLKTPTASVKTPMTTKQ